MHIACILFFVAGVILSDYDSPIAIASLIGCALLCLLCYVKGALKWKDLSPIFYRIINVPTVLAILCFGLYHSKNKFLFIIIMIAWIVKSLLLLPLWTFMFREYLWQEKYKGICDSLDDEEKIMLEFMSDSVETDNFRAFIEKFSKRSVRKIVTRSNEDEMFLCIVCALIEAREYKRIKSLLRGW